MTIELLAAAGKTRTNYTEHLTLIEGDATTPRQGTEGGFGRLLLELEKELATLQ